jgi:hypothetical protein
MSKFSAENNAKASPFLKLPGELRNMIYSFVVPGHRIDIDHWRGPRTKKVYSDDTIIRDETRGHFAILHVCQQTYHDTVTMRT